MRIVAFVPAKGVSERIAAKNMQVLDGEYLFKRKLRQLLECNLIDEVYLDTESEEMIQFCSDLPVKILKRDPALATNSTDGHELFANECRQVPGADIYIQALCTAPFVDASTIARAITELINSKSSDSLVAITRSKQYLWEGGKPLYGFDRIPNSVDLPVTEIEAMSLYIMRQDSSRFPDKRFGERSVLFPLSQIEAIDVNNPEDLAFAETVCAGARLKEFNFFRLIKAHLSSCILSDLTKELGLTCTLPQDIRPQSAGSFLGRAKTLKLSALANEPDRAPEKDNWKGIYEALRSYAFVRSGDVILVSTEVKERAYFGDLNAHLAVRAGCVGVVVDGFTRDIEGVAKLGLPLYAKGPYCNDIKYEGTTGAMNFPITIGEVNISNGDVVYADIDGIVAVPSRHWLQVSEAAFDVIRNEGKIKIGAALGQPINELLEKFGYF